MLICRFVNVDSSDVVDVSSAVAAEEASNSADLNVLLTEVSSVRCIELSVTTGVSSERMADIWAGRATVAAVSGSTVGWAGTVVATASETTVTLGTLRSS